jgi:hypothetical protein
MKKFLSILVVAILATSLSFANHPCDNGGGGAGTGCDGLPGTGTAELVVEICYEDIEVTLTTSAFDLYFLMYPGQTITNQHLNFTATGSAGIGINNYGAAWTGTVAPGNPGISITDWGWDVAGVAFNGAGEAYFDRRFDITANPGTPMIVGDYNLGFSFTVAYN